jgi:hypothetical protein
LVGNAFSAINNAFCGTTTDDKDVILKASVPMHANSNSLSNEIDESDFQYEKHAE